MEKEKRMRFKSIDNSFDENFNDREIEIKTNKQELPSLQTRRQTVTIS